MKNSHRNILVVIVAAGLSIAAQAQSKGDIVVEKRDSSPYAVDARGVIWRSNTGHCWRTGTWSKEAAQSAKVVGESLPAGCFCEKELFAKEICEPPPPVVTPAAAPRPVPAPVPVPAPLPPAAAPAAEKVTLPADALFAFDKAEITQEGKEKVEVFATNAKKLSLEVITVVGHADRIGSDSYNQTLSEKRANAMKDLLISLGIDANRIYAEGKGEAQPVTGESCKNLGRESGKNKKLVDCLGPDRRVDLEAVGTRPAK